MGGGSNRATAGLAVAAAAALASATAAVAVPAPPSATFTGTPSQTGLKDREVRIRTNAAGRVSRADIPWSAKCTRPGKFWTTTTKFSEGKRGLAQDGDTFHDAGTYTGRSGRRITGKTKISMKGSFTDGDHVKGTLKARVKVRRDGTQIDHCKVSIGWKARR